MHWHIRYFVLAVVAVLGVAACGSAGTSARDDKPTLRITSPTDGATVQVPFTLTYDSSVQLGPTDSGRDHVHVFTDGKTDQYTVVPTTSFQVKDLTPGRHTVGVTLQHADHSPAGAHAEVTVTVTGSGPAASSTPSAATTSRGNGY